MTDRSENKLDKERDEQTIARLMRLAGGSEQISPDVESRVYERVRAEWTSSTTQPDSGQVYASVRREWHKTSARSPIRRWGLPAALAAAILLAVAVVIQPAPPVPANVPVGTIVKNTGNSAGQYDEGSLVYPGETITTGQQGGMSITLANAESLRVDAMTSLSIVAGNEFRLHRGRVYADTGDFMFRDKGLIIETDFGSVTDVGTQFSVHAQDDSLDVAVREGRVDIMDDTREIVAVAGERLILEPGHGATVLTLESHDDYWSWTTDLTPSYDLENRSLLDFLRWVARETGRELVFEDNELRMAATRTDLHGSVQDFAPVEAVAAVMSTTSFKYRLENDKILIFREAQ